MPTTIQKLLKKKGWTGAELGKLLIASYLNDIKKSVGKAKRDLFTQAEFGAMHDTLTSSYEEQVLSVYSSILTGLENIIGFCRTSHFAFHDGFNRFLLPLYEIVHTEAARERFEQTPYVVTQAQYDRLVSQATEKKRRYIDTYSMIFCEVLYRCFDAKHDDKKAPRAILAAIEQTKAMPAQGSYFYASYTEKMNIGHWFFPDGKRCEDVKSQMRRILLEHIKVKGYEEFLDKKLPELFFYGASAIRAFLKKLTGSEPPQTDEELEQNIKWIVDHSHIEEMNPWHRLIAPCLGGKYRYDDPPETLSMFNVLPLYTEGLREAADQPKQAQKLLTTFKKELPDLFAAVTAYIEEMLPSTKGIKAKDYGKPFLTWGELADAGLYGYDKLIAISTDNFEIAGLFLRKHGKEDTSKMLQARRRIVYKGIAIAQNPPANSVDKNGDFIDTKPFQLLDSIDNLAENQNKRDFYRNAREKAIKPTYKTLSAYNVLIGILEKVFDIPELTAVTRYDTQKLDILINQLNAAIYQLYLDVYGTEEEKETKRRTIKEVLEPINIQELQPKQEAIDRVTKEIQELGFSMEAKQAFRNLAHYLLILAGIKA